jgi:YVTN family beta-propeller protein
LTFLFRNSSKSLKRTHLHTYTSNIHTHNECRTCCSGISQSDGQTLVKFIESVGEPFSILRRPLRITNYINTLTTWILVLVAAAAVMDGITVYSESINPSNSTRIVTTVPVGSRPHSIDFGLGKVFITNSGSDSVSVIDAKTDRVIATIPVGANPHGIAAVINDDEDDNSTLDSNLLLKFPYMYVVNTDSNTVSVIDAKTDRVIATIPVGANPHGIITSITLGKVYVSNSGSNSVSVIDSKTNEVVASVPVGSNPEELCQIFQNGTNAGTAAPTTTIYVINTGSNSISAIDGRTNKVVATIPVGSQPHGIIANDISAKVYVTNSGSNSVSVIDSKTNRVVATIPVGANPHRLDLFMSTVYVTNSGSNSVSVIDSKTNRVVATIPVDPLPRGIAVDGSGIAYTTNKEASSVSVIDSETNSVITNIPVGRIPNDVVVASSSYPFYKIYITNSGSNSVSIIAG